jgi:hypothetical protein
MADEAPKLGEKWAPLVALLNDALRAFPPGWRMQSLWIDDGEGTFKSLHWNVTNGVLAGGIAFPEIVLREYDEDRLKMEVTHRVVRLLRELEQHGEAAFGRARFR